MTTVQFCILVGAIWLAPHAGERYSAAMSLLFFVFAAVGMAS
jgi:hypothetical protein